MTTSRDPERLFASWMAEGPATLRDDILAGVAVEVGHTAQHRGLRPPWARLPTVLRAATMATGAVAGDGGRHGRRRVARIDRQRAVDRGTRLRHHGVTARECRPNRHSPSVAGHGGHLDDRVPAVRLHVAVPW